MADTAQIVQSMNAGWRNYVNDAMTLNKETFQLAQGTLGLQTPDSSGLFLMEDAVPPSSTVGYYSPSTTRSRSSAYLILLSALLPETSPIALQQALGDMYSNWIAYKTTSSNWTSGATLLSVYQNWTNQSPIDPGRARAGRQRYKPPRLPHGARPLPLTIYPPINKRSPTPTGPHTRCADTRELVRMPLLPSTVRVGSATINFDTATMDTSTSATFAQGSASGFYDIFSGGVSGSFNQQNAKAAGSRFTITGTINKFTTLSCGPGAWYTSGEVSRAFSGKGNVAIWDPQVSAGNWDSFFAAQWLSGPLCRRDHPGVRLLPHRHFPCYLQPKRLSADPDPGHLWYLAFLLR